MTFIDLEMIKDSLKRNSIWVILALVGLYFLAPQNPELRTFFLIITVECMAILLSTIATKVYTSIDFTQTKEITLGFIFTGVHICVGLTVLGVYIAQFTP